MCKYSYNIKKFYKNIYKQCCKTIKTSAKIIIIIAVKNTVMQNALNRQITGTKKMNMKICETFPIFLKIFCKKILWTLDFGKLREFILNMAKIHKPLQKKEISDVLSCRIVLKD